MRDPTERDPLADDDLAELLNDLFPEYDLDAEADAILTELDSWEAWHAERVGA